MSEQDKESVESHDASRVEAPELTPPPPLAAEQQTEPSPDEDEAPLEAAKPLPASRPQPKEPTPPSRARLEPEDLDEIQDEYLHHARDEYQDELLAQDRDEEDDEDDEMAPPPPDEEDDEEDEPAAPGAVASVTARPGPEGSELLVGEPEPAPAAPSEPVSMLVGVLFMDGKVLEFDPRDFAVSQGDLVVVDNEKDLNMGRVVFLAENNERKPLRPVLRSLGKDDQLLICRNKKREQEAFDFCLKRIVERNLPMKLIRVAYLHGGNKAIFYFSSEGRVDFRALVRDLAQQLHVRIEMRQIGVRDEAKMLGGVGICGQQLCCARFLRKFVPVSIKMAKNQSLALNPQKLSGLCGRLMCCLVYEDDAYRQLRRGLPKLGGTVQTPKGPGKVLDLGLFTGKLQIELHEDGSVVAYTARELRLRDDGTRPEDRDEAHDAEEQGSEELAGLEDRWGNESLPEGGDSSAPSQPPAEHARRADGQNGDRRRPRGPGNRPAQGPQGQPRGDGRRRNGRNQRGPSGPGPRGEGRREGHRDAHAEGQDGGGQRPRHPQNQPRRPLPPRSPVADGNVAAAEAAAPGNVRQPDGNVRGPDGNVHAPGEGGRRGSRRSRHRRRGGRHGGPGGPGPASQGPGGGGGGPAPGSGGGGPAPGEPAS